MNIDSEIYRFTLFFRDPVQEAIYHTEQKNKRDKVTLVSVWVFYIAWLSIAIYSWIETFSNAQLAQERLKYLINMIVTATCLLLEVCTTRLQLLTRTRGFWFMFSLFGPLCVMAREANTASIVLPM